jgi:alkylhydroperoxidase/carboxymuconolactone decarboxylase family protein YurZ
LVDAVLNDHRNAPLAGDRKALFTLIEKVALVPNEVTEDDVAAAKAAGATEEMIYDAITVCALFKFYTTWVDGSGVAKMADESYAQSGQRIAGRGYVPTE